MNGNSVTTKYQEFVNYIAVFGLIAISGMTYFYKAQVNLLLLFAFTLFIYLKRSIQFDSRALTIMIIFYVVDILQVLFIKPFTPMTLLGTYLRLFLGLFIVSLCDKKFIHYYSQIIYVLCIISFFFYIPSILSNSFYSLFHDKICNYFPAPFAETSQYYIAQPTIIIYTFHSALLEFRNSGPFWEPGAFAIFIIIAFLFNIIESKKLWTKQNIVLSVALLTTLSTSGFIAFFVAIISFYLATGSLVKNLLILAIALPIAIPLYFNLDFLNSKIENNIEIAGDDRTSRFGSGLADIKDFSTSPLIGWGKGLMRFGGKTYAFFSADQHRNNGLTGLLASSGIFVFSVYLFNYYKTLNILCISNSFNSHFAILAFIVILLLSFSQSIFQYPFFFTLMFVHLPYTLKKVSITTK